MVCKCGQFNINTSQEWCFFFYFISLLEFCPSLTAETEVNVAGNSTIGLTNSAVHQTGGSPSPSSSPPPSLAALGPQAIPRRHAPADVIARQGSFRGFPVLSQKTSPFKRQLSLRMNELPSTMQRKSDFPMKNTGETNCQAVREQQEEDSPSKEAAP